MNPPLPEFLRPLEYESNELPLEALNAAIERREESTPYLLEALTCDDLRGAVARDDDRIYMLHLFALYLLAQFRETRALPLVLDLLRDPQLEEFTGDLVTDDIPRALASVVGADLGPVKELIEDRDLDAMVRVAGIHALGVLVHNDSSKRPEVSAYFGELFAHRLEREPTFVWDMLIEACVDLGMTEHLGAIRQLYKDDIANPRIDTLKGIERRFAKPRDRNQWGEYTFIEDAIKELKEWACYQPGGGQDDWDDDDDDWEPEDEELDGLLKSDVPPLGTAVRPEPKVGRNDLCPCGSGKKYKKCCGQA